MGNSKIKDVSNLLWKGFDTTKQVRFDNILKKIRQWKYPPRSFSRIQEIVDSYSEKEKAKDSNLFEITVAFRNAIRGFLFAIEGVLDSKNYLNLVHRPSRKTKYGSRWLANYTANVLISSDYYSCILQSNIEECFKQLCLKRVIPTVNAGIIFENFTGENAFQVILLFLSAVKITIESNMKKFNISRDRMERSIVFPKIDVQFEKWAEFTLERSQFLIRSEKERHDLEIEANSICFKVIDELRLLSSEYYFSKETDGPEFSGRMIPPFFKEEYITLSKAAKLATVNRGTISRWINDKKILDNGKRRRERRVMKSSLFLWLQQRTINERQKGFDEYNRELNLIPEKH